MAKVAICLELGGNLGHWARCLTLAGELEAIGREAIFVVGESVDAPPSTRIHVAPKVRDPARFLRIPGGSSSYAEILMGSGYDAPSTLRESADAWRSRLADVAPDVVVADHAPTAALAARSLGIPSTFFGDGFCNPVTDGLQPWFREDAPRDERRMRWVEDRVSRSVSSAFGGAGATVADALAGIGRIHCVRTELDPFAPRPERHVGPVPDPFAVLPADDGGEIDLVAYLRPGTHAFDAVVGGGLPSGLRCVLVSPGAAPSIDSPSDLRIVDHPVDLSALLGKARLSLSHGGIGFLGRCLDAGVASCVVPETHEQLVNARSLQKHGVGVATNPEALRDGFDWLDRSDVLDTARRMARTDDARTSSLRQIVAMIHETMPTTSVEEDAAARTLA